jgi:2-methylisocitrate lyase-like PEP mutase family enzyme
LGYPDGRQLPAEQLIAAVANMARVLTVPLTVDIENGYSDDPKVVADHVMQLVNLGVSGINIEDGSDDAELLALKIEAIRKALSRGGDDLFINARSDVFLAKLVGEEQLVAESIARAKLYADAGADGLFLPGLWQGGDITAVVDEIRLPLNVMAWPGLVDAAHLGQWGVRRLSAGSGIAQAIWATAETLADDFLKSGDSTPMSEKAMPYGQLQGLFTRS